MDICVQTKLGTLCGEQKEGYSQFLGIPFAKPPVGELRFRKPVPMEPWDGVRQAKEFTAYSIQPGEPERIDKNIKGSEDCLTLNIFTPACDEKKRPVVVWIHGGAYLTGNHTSATKMGGQMCIDSDIVVVPIQYRLGALGCVNFAALSGANGRFDTNCGTWDQLAAVNWVIENIHSFGGDPECITLMGESAGACSVLTLMTSPYLKGKIKRAVMDSPAPHLIHTAENGRIAALDIIRRLGIAEEEAYKIADLPADVLTKAVEESEYDYVNHYPYLIPTAPVVDGDLIPELPYDAVMHGAADGIQVLTGSTRDEATLFAQGNNKDLFPATVEQMDKFFADHPEIDKEKILKLYPDYPSKKSFQEIGKEIFFHLPTVDIAYHMAEHAKSYVFHFDYALPMIKLLGYGAAHCTNSAFTAGIPIKTFLGWFAGKKGELMRDRVHHYWCNFIATGDPNGNGEPDWPECGMERNTNFLDVKCHVEKAPFEKERQAYGVPRPYKN